MNQWQPIETAPRDGRWFCACDPRQAHAYRARWNGDDYESEERHIHLKLHGQWHGYPPTMWTYLPDPPWMMPLPAPPVDGRESGTEGPNEGSLRNADDATVKE